MLELNRDKNKEQINCFRYKKEPNIGLASYRNGSANVKLKACRQLPKALQPKSLKGGPKLFSFDGNARSQPAFPVMKFRQYELLSHRNQFLSLNEPNWKKTPSYWSTKVYKQSDVSNFVEHPNGGLDVNRGEFINPANNAKPHCEVSGTIYRSRRVIQESLCPLLREALRKDDEDHILENVLKNMKMKNDQELNKVHQNQMNLSVRNSLSNREDNFRSTPFRDDTICSTSGLLFTVNIMKSGNKCLGISLDTSTRNGKEVVVIKKLFKGRDHTF